MSSKTKNWTEADFRRELKSIDDYVKTKYGIELNGSELKIGLTNGKCVLGSYSFTEQKFRFSLAFFNSDVPEACAIDVIRHEYAHYYAYMIFGSTKHDSFFKAACEKVRANPQTRYSRIFEEHQRHKEEEDSIVYTSSFSNGQEVFHPSFGKGRIIAIDIGKQTAMLTIEFEKHGMKKIDELWLKKHGKF